LWVGFGGMALAAVATAGACGYPNFTFQSGGGGHGTTTSSTTGGHGGNGGGPTTSTTVTSTGTGGASTTSTSSAGGNGGSPPVPTVPCLTPTKTECPGHQICCVDPSFSDHSCDECADPTNDCGADLGCDIPQNYVRLTCDEDADCTVTGQVCCVHTDGIGDVTGIVCASSCGGANDFPVCSPKQTCATGTCMSLGYAGYGYCN
jgi:hypothetical protein